MSYWTILNARLTRPVFHAVAGLFIVTERLGDLYIVLALLIQRPKRVHGARLHEFHVVANVDPAAVTATEAREFVIDRILEHR